MLSNKTLIILTTIFSLLILTTVFFNSCVSVDAKETKADNATYGWNYIDNITKYRNINIDGHEYILFQSHVYGGYNIQVIHSESCSCKKKK